jgi:hypothetical protein
MKKLVAISIIFVLFASFAGAQEIGLSTWSQAVFVPLAIYDKDDVSKTNNVWSSIGPYWQGWGQSPVRVNTTIAGSTEFAGFVIQLGYDGESKEARWFTDVDNAKLWIKPVSMLTLTYGKMKEDYLRGQVGDFSLFAAYGITSYPWAVRNPDTIFRRFEPNHGFHIALTPIEGLYIGTSVDLTNGEYPNGKGKQLPATGSNVWADNIQSAVGYEIANIGLVRAQYVGRGFPPQTGKNKDGNPVGHNDGRIEFAFAFTGLEGLTADVGAKIPLYFDKDDGKAKGRELFQFAVGGDFTSGDFGVKALVNAIFFSSAPGKADTPDFYLYAMPYYNLGAFKVGGEFGFDNKVTKDNNGDPKGALDIGAWIAKPVAGGEFQIGVMLGIPFGDTVPALQGKDNLIFSIPVAATVSF